MMIERMKKQAEEERLTEEKNIIGLTDNQAINQAANYNKKYKITPAVKSRDFLIKHNNEYYDKIHNRLISIAAAPDIQPGDVIIIHVEWKPSRTWGFNPQAVLRATGSEYYTYTSSRVSGCGYCKLSTAVSEAMNQDNRLLKVLYQSLEKNPDLYGGGYSPFRSYAPGVGVDCYRKIVELAGLSWATLSGKMFDVYTITKSEVVK